MIEIPYWGVAVAGIILLLSHWGAYSWGYWRRASLHIRVIGTIALAAIAVPAILISVEKRLEVDFGGMDLVSGSVAIVAIISVTVIEVMQRRGRDEAEQTEVSGMKSGDVKASSTLLTSILREWIDDLSEDDTLHGNLKREILRVIVLRDYPEGELHLSPKISWPKDEVDPIYWTTNRLQ